MARDSSSNKILYQSIESECQQLKKLCQAKIEEVKDNETSALLFNISCLTDDAAKLAVSISEPIKANDFSTIYERDENEFARNLNCLQEKLK